MKSTERRAPEPVSYTHLKPELAYAPGDKVFRTRGISQIISPPELGFLFPTFDQRAANLYHALFYTKHEEEIHQDFIDEIFHTGPLLSAAQQLSLIHISPLPVLYWPPGPFWSWTNPLQGWTELPKRWYWIT